MRVRIRGRKVGQAAVYANAGVAGPTTWNNSDKGANITLSNGFLTITGTAVQGVRSTASHSTGKYYYEFTIDALSGDSISVGVANSSYLPGSTYVGDTNSCGLFLSSGAYVKGGVTGVTVQTYNVLDTGGVAIDLDNKKIWIRKGAAGNWNNDVIGNQNPATNTGGTDITSIVSGSMFAGATVDVTANQLTTNFGATGYNGTAPSGFGNW